MNRFFNRQSYDDKYQKQKNDKEKLEKEMIKDKENQITEKDIQQNFLFGDWITIENDANSIIGHLGTNGLGLELINTKSKLKNFGFFEIVKSEKQTSEVVKYSSKFYLVHVQTGLYLSSVKDPNHHDAFFGHVTLRTPKQKACLFMFKKRAKGFKFNKIKVSDSYQQSVQMALLNLKSQGIKIGSDVRIMNWISGKYLQVVKNNLKSEQNEKEKFMHRKITEKNKIQGQKSKQRLSNFYKQQYSKIKNEGMSLGDEKRKQTLGDKKNQSLETVRNTIWLSSNSDFYNIKLQRRSKLYNPVLLSNYDVVLIYNQFSHSYLTLNKKKPLLHLDNKNSYIQQYSPIINSESISEDKSMQFISTFPIQLNPHYFTPKNCFIEQTPHYMFQNNNIFNYMWKVFSVPSKNQQQTKNNSNFPSLIKSKQIVYFQHLQTGLFLIKNQNQSQSSDQYILKEYLQEPDIEQNSQKNTFLFRIQNITALRHSKEFIFNQEFRPLLDEGKNANIISVNLQPINTSLHVTLDFQEQQFVLNKILQYPRTNYFTFHYPQFIKLLLSFLNNPKAIDDRIYLLKQKLSIMEIIYDNILCEGFSHFIKQIDRGYYFLEKTVIILKIIRLKMKHYELQAINIKSNRQTFIQTKKKQTDNQSNKQKRKDFDPYAEHYIFTDINEPLEQLHQLNTAIFSVLKPLINKILKYLALVFGTQSRQIFELIEEKQTTEYLSNNSKKKPSQNPVQNSNNQKNVVKKKNSAIMSSSLAKKRIRNNSASSFKSNSSSVQGNIFISKDDNQNTKSAFAGGLNQNEKKQCSSQLLKELIKSLVHLFQIEPHGFSQILKLLSVQQPYQIIGQLNERLQKLDSKITQLQGKSSQNRYEGHQSNQNFSITTTLKLYRNLESQIFQEMSHCIKLINHILQYFNEDLQYDWSKRLRYIENHFEIKILSTKDTNLSTQKQTIKKDGQIALHYKKRWFKLSEILYKTQNPNFKKLITFLKEKKKQQSDQKHKKFAQSSKKDHKDEKSQTKLHQEKRYSQSLIKQSQKIISNKSQDKSNSQKYLLVHKKKNQKIINEKHKNSQVFDQKDKFNFKKIMHKRKKSLIIEEDKNHLFQFLRHTIKLMMINLKSTSLTVSDMLHFFENTKNETNQKNNPFQLYSNLSSLGLVLQIANNIDVTLINSLSSSESLTNINISLLNNSRFICCDYEPINEHTNLSKILNFQPYNLEQSYNKVIQHDYPLFLRSENIQYLLDKSPFCLEFYEEIFGFLIINNQPFKDSYQKDLFIQAVSGLKTFLISLEIFVSIGHWNFQMLKKIQKYALKICLLIIINKYQNNKLQDDSQQKSYENSSIDRKRVYQSDKDDQKEFKNKKYQEEIISGLKDAIQSLLVEINQLLEIVYIQKKRVTRYPYIQDSISFFQAQQFLSHYHQLIKSSLYLVNQIPIMSDLFQLNCSLCISSSFSDFQSTSHKKLNSQIPSLLMGIQHRFPISHEKFYPPHKILRNYIQNSQQNSALLTWPYLSLDQIQILYPQQIQLESLTFRRTSQTIIKLNELTLMLNTLESMEENQKVKNHLLIEIRQKITSVSNNLISLPKLQASKKLINSFGLIQIILTIILNNNILEKVSIKPFLEFLIQIKMWNVSFRDFYRVLIKGGMINNFITSNSGNESQFENSINFLMKNIKKQQFFIIVAKYLQQIKSESQKLLITELLSSNLIQLIDYIQGQSYQPLMQKLTFLYLIIEKSLNEQTNLKIFNQLINRQDVQLYMQAFKTFKNFQNFCQNIKSIQTLLENKKLINQRIDYLNLSSDNFTQNRNPKNSSVFSFGTNLGSHGKIKKMSADLTNEKDEMTTFKKQEITKFVILTSTIFKIYKRTKNQINNHLGNFILIKQVLKILRSNISALGNSFQLLKSCLIYLETNEIIFQQEVRKNRSFAMNFSSINLTQTVNKQNQIFQYLQKLNEILSHHYLYVDELETYQSTSSFFLPFIQENQIEGNQPQLEFNKEKVKKISSQLKNFSRKTYFWELLLWNPCYQKEEGLLVMIQKIIYSNLNLFVWKVHGNRRNHNKANSHDILQKLQTPLNRALHSVFDSILNIDSIIQNFKGSRFVRLQTRIKKLKRIFTQIFPTIQASLLNLKSLKLKLMKQNQEQHEGNVIQEEDQNSLGFLSSDDKNIKSHDSSYERQQSFESMSRKMRNIKITKRVIHEPKTLQVKRGTINKEKDNNVDERFNAEMVGYHLVTKLWSNQKLERFIKVFEEEQTRKLIEQQKIQQKTKLSSKQQMQSINLNQKSNPLFAQIGDYLEDESQDYVIDQVPHKNTKEKSQFSKKLHFQPSQNSKEIIQLKHKKSKSQLSELQSLGQSANYSHHAMIIAQNSLNQDTPARKLQTFNEQSYIQSRVTGKSKQRGPKNFLTNAALQSLHTLKNLKRADYSRFYERLKSYQFYEVTILLKKVLFFNSSSQIQQCLVNSKFYDVEHESELYYELQKLFLDFFSLKATINSLFYNIQNYLKLQSQKAAEKQLDFKFCFQISGLTGSGQEKEIEDRILLNKTRNIFQVIESQSCVQKLGIGLRSQILFGLYNRQNYFLIESLIENHLKLYHLFTNQHQENSTYSFTNSDLKSYKSELELNQFLQLLLLFLQRANESPLKINSFHKKQSRKSQPNQQIKQSSQIYSKSKKSHDIKSEDKSLKSSHINLHSSSKFHFTKINTTESFPQTYQQDSNQYQNSLNLMRNYKQFLSTKKTKVLIICGLLKIINFNLSLVRTKRLLDSTILSLLKRVQQSLHRFIYQLVWDFRLLDNELKKQPRNKQKLTQTQKILLAAIEKDMFWIRIKLLQYFSEIIIFLSFDNVNSKGQDNKGQVNSNRKIEFMINQLIEFSLTQSYKQTVIDPFMKRQINHDRNIQEKQKQNNYSGVSLSSIGLLKQYFKSMSNMIQKDYLQRSLYIKPTEQFTYQIIVGTLDESFRRDLSSPNLQSLQFISLLTSCLTFLQIFISSTSSANILKDKSTNQTILVFYQQNKKQIHNGWFRYDVTLKLIQFQIFLYNLLFVNQKYFSNCSYNSYIKQMMKFSQIQTNSKQKYGLYNHQKQKAFKYITLLNLLIHTINIFHNLFFKFSSFPSFQNNLFKQRKLLIEHNQKLKINIDNLKDMYQYLGEILKWVIISPQKGKKQLEVVTFPFYKEFQFVWKSSIIRIFQSCLSQKQRKNLIFNASQIFLSYNFSLRKIIHHIIKWSTICTEISQIFIILLLFINLFLGGFQWLKIINYLMLTINLMLILVMIMDKLASTVIMTSVLKINQKVSFFNSLTVLIVIFLPVIITLTANIYSYWQTRAIPFMLFIFLSHRLEKLYINWQKYNKRLKSVFTFLFTSILTIFAFRFFTKFGFNLGLPENQSYLQNQTPIFTIDGKSFNFLNLIFQLPKDEYATNPIIVLFYIWFYSIQILAIALIIVSIIQKIKMKNKLNSQTGKNFECPLCYSKAQSLVQQYIKKAVLKDNTTNNFQRYPENRLKSYVFDNKKYLKKLKDDKNDQINEFQIQQEMKQIIQSHIKQRHNLFQYISYFCYLLDKKQIFLSGKEKKIKKRIEQNDYEVYL